MDLSYYIEGVQAQMRGRPGEILLPDEGVFTKAIVLEKKQNLRLPGGTSMKSRYDQFGGRCAPILCKGENVVYGNGHNCVLEVSADHITDQTNPANVAEEGSYIMIRPYDGSLASPFTPPTTIFHDITVRDLCIRGKIGAFPSGALGGVINLDNCQDSLVQNVRFDSLPCIAFNAGGDPAGLGRFARRPRIFDCIFIGGNDKDHGEVGRPATGIQLSLANCVGFHVARCEFYQPPNGAAFIDVEAPGNEYHSEGGTIENCIFDYRFRQGDGGGYMDDQDNIAWPQMPKHPVNLYTEYNRSAYGIIIHGDISTGSGATLQGVKVGPMKIFGNTFRGAWCRPSTLTPVTFAQYGIFASGPYSYGLDITENKFEGINGEAIFLDGQYHNVQLNRFTYCGGGARTISVRGRHITVLNNTFDFMSGGTSTNVCIEEVDQYPGYNFTDYNCLGGPGQQMGWTYGNALGSIRPPWVKLLKDLGTGRAPNSHRGEGLAPNGNTENPYDPDGWKQAEEYFR